MERNTVNISLEEYNKLRDFKDEVLKMKSFKTVKWEDVNGNHFDKITFYSESELIVEFDKKLTKLNKELCYSRNCTDEYRRDYYKAKDLSVRQFKRWKNYKLNLKDV